MQQSSSQVLILGATYGTGNLGVDALLSGTIASVSQSAPDAEIHLLDFSHESRDFEVPHRGATKTIRLENIRFSWKFWLCNNAFRLLGIAILMRMLPFGSLKRHFLKEYPTLDLIGRSDVALSLAGGDSFSDIYGFRRLLYVCLPQFLVQAMNCPLVVLPQTLGPFKAGWAKWMGSKVMNGSEKVYSRDRESIRIAGDMIDRPDEKLVYSEDMAFALRPHEPRLGVPDWAQREGKPRPLVGINVSGLLFMGGYTRDNMFGLECDYPELMRGLIRKFLCETDAEVVLVSHVGGREDDSTASKALYEEFVDEADGRLHLADPSFDHREIKYLIGKCDFFMGARMHACIAALSQGVPAVGMAYSRKFAGVFESVDVPELVTDLRKLEAAEAVEQIGSLFENRGEYAAKLKVAAPKARGAAEGLFAKIMLQVHGQRSSENGATSPEAVAPV